MTTVFARMRLRRWLALALAVMTAGVLAPFARAEVQTLSSGGQAAWPQLTAQALGGFRILWWEGPFLPQGAGRRWQAVSAVGSSVFGAASPLATFGSFSTTVEAPDGETVVWLDGADRRVYYVLRRADGSVTAPRPLSAAGRPATEPGLAADAAGNAIACWQRRAGRFWRAQCAIRRAGSDTFGAVATLANGGGRVGRWGFPPRPFLGRRGRLLVIYENRWHALAALGSVERGFKAGVAFDEHDLDFLHARAAVAANGSATVVVTDGEPGPNGTNTVRAWRFSASGRPSSQLLRKRRFEAQEEIGSPALAGLVDGSALAAWPVGRRLMAARARPGRPFGRAVSVASLGPLGAPFGGPELAAGPDGSAALTWTDETGDMTKAGSSSQVVHSARYAHSAWGPPILLAAHNEIAHSPRVAVSADGTVAVAWVQDTGATGRNIKAVIGDS